MYTVTGQEQGVHKRSKHFSFTGLYGNCLLGHHGFMGKGDP